MSLSTSFFLFALLSSLLLLQLSSADTDFTSRESPWELLLIPGTIFPTPREGHTATLIGNQVYVYGGYYPSRAFWGRARVPHKIYDQLFVLDMSSFEWDQLSGEPVYPQGFDGFGSGRTHSSSSSSTEAHGTRKMHAADEEDEENGILIARATPVTNEEILSQSSFRFLNNLQMQQIEQAATRSSSSPSSSTLLKSIEKQRIVPDEGAPPALGSHCAVALNGQLYIFGGLYGSGNISTNNLYRYNPVKSQWSLLTSESGPAPRAGATAWVEGTSRIYIFGGYNPATSEAFSDTWYYDVKASEWVLVPTSPTIPGPRVFTNAVPTRVGTVLYSGQTNAPYTQSNLADNLSIFISNWTVLEATTRTNPIFPLPASNAATAFFEEKDTFVSIGGLGGPWARQINRCGWYNPNENNFVGYDAVGDVRLYLKDNDLWERGSDAPFWSFRNLTGRVFGAASVHYGNNLFFFGGVGCEDLIGRGVKPLPALYGRFNQIPVYNVYADERTMVGSASSISISVSVIIGTALMALAFSI